MCGDNCGGLRVSCERHRFQRMAYLYEIERARAAMSRVLPVPNIGLDVAVQHRIELQQVERSTDHQHLPHGKRPPIKSNVSSQTIYRNKQSMSNAGNVSTTKHDSIGHKLRKF